MFHSGCFCVYFPLAVAWKCYSIVRVPEVLRVWGHPPEVTTGGSSFQLRQMCIFGWTLKLWMAHSAVVISKYSAQMHF